MKTVVSQFIVAILFVIVGAGLWLASKWERRAADADAALATLQYSVPAGEYSGLADSMRSAQGLPGLDPLVADIREHRAAAQYWQAVDVAPDRNPNVVFVVANAAFRAAQRDRERGAFTRHLDDVLKQYGEVLKANPDNVDAAYNYEFVSRLRKAAAKAKGEPTPKAMLAPPATGELPAGPTIHGHPGAPPKGVNMGQFKVQVPMRPEERKEEKQEEAGKGGLKVRRG